MLNGDIDNYAQLKADWEQRVGGRISDRITTDTKIIPLQVEYYLLQGHDLTESFRRAVNDFEGSQAITMQSDLEPNRIFLALRGSGQSIFVKDVAIFKAHKAANIVLTNEGEQRFTSCADSLIQIPKVSEQLSIPW